MSTSRHSSSTETLRAALPPLLLLAAVIALYGAAVGYDFVYDDRVLILHNAALQSWSTLPEALTRDLFHFSPSRASPYWRPVITLSYYLEYALGGGAPWVFHLSNLLVFWLSAVGLRQLCGGELRGTLLALLWVCWPLQVEAAVNIAGRTDLFCLALGLLSLQQRRAWARGLSAFLACASKEVGLLWVAAAAASGRPWRAQALGTASYLLLRALLTLQWPETGAAVELQGAALFEAPGRCAWLLLRLIWPAWLAPALEWEAPTVALQVLGVTGWILLVIGWKSLRGAPPPLRGGLVLLLGAPLMVCGLIQSEPRYGDTLLLLPAAGSVWALSVLPAERPQLGLLAGLALLGALLGLGRVPEWKTEERLWEGAHRRLPEDAVIRMKLARVWVHDQPAESLALLDGVEAGPRRPLRELSELRARAWERLGEPERQLAWLWTAVAEDPEARWANSALCILSARRQLPESEEACRRALRWTPEDPHLHNFLGLSLIREGRSAAALASFREAQRLAPEEPAFQRNVRSAESELRQDSGEEAQ